MDVQTSNRLKRILNIISTNLPYFTAIVVGFLLGLVQAISASVPTERLLGIMLIILSTLGINSIVERAVRLENMETSLKEIRDVVRILDPDQHVRLIKGAEHWYEYVSYAMGNAKNHICDAALTCRLWKRNSNSGNDFYKKRQNIISEKTVNTRYLTVFKSDFKDESSLERIKGDLERIKMIKDNLEKFGGPDHNYYSSYLPQLKGCFPMMSFLIVDDKELILGFYLSEYDRSEIDTSLIINSPKIIRLFEEYFNFLWRKATKLDRDSNDLEEIEERLNARKKVLEES